MNYNSNRNQDEKVQIRARQVNKFQEEPDLQTNGQEADENFDPKARQGVTCQEAVDTTKCDEAKDVVKDIKLIKHTFKKNHLNIHSYEIFNSLIKLRDSPLKYEGNVTNLLTKYPNNKDKLDYSLDNVNEEDLTATKKFLRKISNQNVDCIMWNEKIFQVLNASIENFDHSNNREIMTKIASSLPDLDITDFTLFNHLDFLDSILMIVTKSEENRQNLL